MKLATADVMPRSVNRIVMHEKEAHRLPFRAPDYTKRGIMIRPNAPGWLIVLEGIDGAGKSTVVRRIAEHCAARGLECVTSAEPTRGTWGMRLRQSMTEGRLSLEDELGLFLKDRAEHVENLISPALRQGKVVILDRYYISTAAYQGARGVSPEWVLLENERFAPKPDLVLLLDFDPAAGLDRIRARGDKPNTFEQLDQLCEVRRIFLTLERPFIRRVDASASPEAVWQSCRENLDSVLLP
jgi:dTMP kinase